MGKQKLIGVSNGIVRMKNEIQTDIFNGGSSEFFINMNPKDIPPIGHEDRGAFISGEKAKCRKGIFINGVYITGRLYYHLNFHKIALDTIVDDVEQRIVANPLLRDNEWIVFNEYEKAINAKPREAFILSGARQILKDLLNSSLLYQKDKEITIGDAKVGDEIYDDSGKLTTIKGVYPQGKQSVYKITLVDKRVIFAGANHNWWVYDISKKKYSKKTTLEILSDYKMYRESWKKRENPYVWRYSIDLCKPVQYEEKQLPISPYMMGVWLGDGDSRRFAITTMDKEVEDEIYKYSEQANLSVKKYVNKNRVSKASHYSFTFGKGYKKTKGETCYTNQVLKDLNLVKNKHIPNMYLFGSPEQRLELLKGLLDSDGTCTKGSVSFTNTNLTLVKNVEKVVRSLGMSCSLKENKPASYTYKGEKKQGKEYYTLQIFSDIPLFKIKRKYEKQSISKYSNRVAINNIEYVYDADTTCIEVDNESHLYLTDGYTITHNTEFECSTSLYQLNLFKNSEAMLLFTNSPDKQTYAKKAQVALSAGEPFMMLPLIDNDWKKTEIRFGETYKDNTSNVLGRLFLYNTDGDNASEIGAGKSLNYFAYDEIAKKEFRKSYEAVLPALDSPYGLRCSPILAFTGGDVVKSKDADELFHAPKTGKARVYINEGKETGFFMGGWYRQPFKYKKNFREYLNENGYDLKKGSSLDTMDILVTDFDKANKMIDEERADAAKASDPSVLNKKIMYSPRNIKEMFMKDVTNRFKKEYIEQQREFVKAHVTYDTVDLARDIHTKEVKTKQVNRPIIHDWKNPSYALNAPVCIYDYPKYVGYGVHVIGYDPVRENEVGNSESLCYITVWRRMHSDLSDPFRGKQVASWLGRKPTVKENNQLLLDLAEFYGAQIMYEHSDRSVLDFFEPRHKAHLLIDTIPLQKEISVKAKTKNQKGLKPTVPNQTFLLESALGFVNNEIDDDVYGYTTINDDVLLQQLEIYDPTENLDCYIGFAHAVAAYNYFEKFGTPVVTLNNKVEEKKKTSTPIKNAFGMNFKHKPKNAFGL